MIRVPGVDGRTDARGRALLNPYLGRVFTVQVSGPAGSAFLSVRKRLAWPRGAARQDLTLALPRGVRVTGTVTAAPGGRPVSGARVDFWSKTVRPPATSPARLPDGLVYPGPCKTDARGAFALVVPPGPCHFLVNGPGPDYVFRKIDPTLLGVKPKIVEPGRKGQGVPAPRADDYVRQTIGWRVGKKPFFYPDAWKPVNAKRGAKPPVLAIQLRKAQVVKGRVLGPDGKPVALAAIYQGQPPFAEIAHSTFGLRDGVRDGRFELKLRNPEAPLSAVFWARDKGLGAAVEFTAKQANGKPVTVRLARCGSATVRFLGVKGKPLAHYRPLLWLSVPALPYSTPLELEAQARQVHFGYDVVWAGHAEPAAYGKGPKTDAQGRVTFPALIPGATYRITLFDGRGKDFRAEAGKAVKLADLTVRDLKGTDNLPNLPIPKGRTTK
jgi:hypothetical protein